MNIVTQLQIEGRKYPNDTPLSINNKLLNFLLASCIAPCSGSPPISNVNSMMPLAPISAEIPAAHKPKIGFSIDSIVGGDGSGGKGDEREDSPLKPVRSHRPSSIDNHKGHNHKSDTPSPEPSMTDIFPKNNVTSSQHSQFHNNNNIVIGDGDFGVIPSRPIPIMANQTRAPHSHHHHSPGSNSSSTNSPGVVSLSGNHNSIISNSKDKVNRLVNNRNKNRHVTTTSSSQTPSPNPEVVEIHKSRPSSTDSGTTPMTTSDFHHDKHIPPQMISARSLPSPPHPIGAPFPQFGGMAASYPPGMLNFAAAAAAAAAASTPHHHPGLPTWMQPPPAPHPHHPLYPWLLAKHSRLFPHRFGPGPDLPGFLLQPFRKPKRIRTAFSPSQLLKLEHAFERNHYVVGAERKQLANSLSLSETQVKVWFQNRRTKHKRMQQEEECAKRGAGGNGGGAVAGSGSDLPSSASNLSSAPISADSSTRNYSEEGLSEEEDDEEEILMDESYSDEEEMIQLHRNSHHHHHLQKLQHHRMNSAT